MVFIPSKTETQAPGKETLWRCQSCGTFREHAVKFIENDQAKCPICVTGWMVLDRGD